MRRIRYRVAVSLDGFIAGPNGEIDWITMDPDVDFAAVMSEFDTLVMGRHTFDLFRTGPGPQWGEVVVVSTTLRGDEHPGITLVSDDVPATVAALKAKRGKDIWLFGGAVLFTSLLDEGLVDGVEVSVMPVILGAGVPLAAPLAARRQLHLVRHRVYRSGLVSLHYDVVRATAA